MSESRRFNPIRATRWTLMLTLGLTLGLGVYIYAPLTGAGVSGSTASTFQSAPQAEASADPWFSGTPSDQTWSGDAPSLSDQPQAPYMGRSRGS